MNTKNITYIAFNVALIVCGALMSIPFLWVPFTLQVLMISLVSWLHSTRLSVWSVSVYLLLGFMGFPFFNGAQGGLGMLFSPTVGFLMGFIPYAYVIAKFKHTLKPIPLFIFSSLILYGFGLSGLSLIFKYHLNLEVSSFSLIFKFMIPFIPTDFLAFSLSRQISIKLTKQIKLHFEH